MNNNELLRVATQAPANASVLARQNGRDPQIAKVISAQFSYNPPELLLELTPKADAKEGEPLQVLREIHTHAVNLANEVIELGVYDVPGAGGAHHLYGISIPHTEPGVPFWREQVWIRFQNGPILEAGVNGLTHEVLLAIVLDRLECFQRGPFACKDNEDAIGLIKAGLTCLQKRTRTRIAQNVEGQNVQHKETLPTGENPTRALSPEEIQGQADQAHEAAIESAQTQPPAPSEPVTAPDVSADPIKPGPATVADKPADSIPPAAEPAPETTTPAAEPKP